MSGKSALDKQPELAKLLAELLAAGLNHSQISEQLQPPVHKDTVGRWAKDKRVQAHLTELIQQRVNRITRRIDSAIEERIQHLGAVDLETLIKVRRELLPPAKQRIEVSRGPDVDSAAAELYERLASNPDLAEALGAGNIIEGEAEGLPDGDPEGPDGESEVRVVE